MLTGLRQVSTRFRAYQLDTPGSSFSYFACGKFTLIEAMVTDLSRPRLLEELAACGKKTIDTLHITSWDNDHCDAAALDWILRNLPPHRIEYPGYTPETDCGKQSLRLILQYRAKWTEKGYSVIAQKVDPPYISSLAAATALGYQDIVYHPKRIYPTSNDNSTVKFFRTGAFNVLSLGDVQDPSIGSLLKACSSLCREVDVMILAHHGADNGFTTKALLEKLSPTVAVCSSDYSNQYDHPRQEIRDLLWEQGIPVYTTKTGDVVMRSVGGHTMDYEVLNFRANSTDVSSRRTYRSRKSDLLRMNQDTIRAVMNRPNRGPAWAR